MIFVYYQKVPKVAVFSRRGGGYQKVPKVAIISRREVCVLPKSAKSGGF